jgi:hypothetical protein
MLRAKGLPNWFWGEVVLAAVYVLNRTPSKSVDGATPFEVWYGKKPSVHYLHTFGCIAYVRNTRPHLSKLGDRGQWMIFIGYEMRTKAYRVYDLVARRVHITRDVVFDEAAQWDWDKEVDEQVSDHGSFTVEYMVMSTGDLLEESTIEDDAELLVPSPAGAPTSPYSDDEPESPQPGSPQQVSPDRLDADHDDAPLCLRSMDSIIGQAEAPGLEQGIWSKVICLW